MNSKLFKELKIDSWVKAAKDRKVFKINNEIFLTYTPARGLTIVMDGVVFKRVERPAAYRMLDNVAEQIYDSL